MKKVSKKMLFGMVCLGLFFMGTGKGFAGPIELNFVGEYIERHPVTQQAFIPWCKSMEEMSGGRVKVHYYPPNTLVPNKEGYEAVISGMIDIWGAPTFYNADRFPELMLLALPFISPGAEAGGLVAMEILEKFPKIKARFDDTKFLFLWAAPSMQLHTTKKLVKTLDDLKGLRIIGFNSQLLGQIKALGANPISMIPPDVYMALQRGTADGVMFPLAPLRAMKITDVTKYHTIIDYGTGPFNVMMNKERFNSLPADIQKMIEETTGKKLCRKVGKILDRSSVVTSKWMKANGHTFYKLPGAERQKWIEKVAPAVEKQLSKVERKIPHAREVYNEAKRLGVEIGKTTGRGYQE